MRNTSAGSTPSKAASRASSARPTQGAASSAEPIRFSRRSTSRAPVTTASTDCTRAHRSASTSLRQAGGVSGKTRSAFGPASGNRVVQASSVVKQAIGDSHAVSRWKQASITVRQARRVGLAGASQ